MISADCNPVEVKLRLSFRRVEDRDYQAVDWDGTRMDMFGMFTTGERRGYTRNYGVVDDKWYRFASRHNIWVESHARDGNGEVIAERGQTNDRAQDCGINGKQPKISRGIEAGQERRCEHRDALSQPCRAREQGHTPGEAPLTGKPS